LTIVSIEPFYFIITLLFLTRNSHTAWWLI